MTQPDGRREQRSHPGSPSEPYSENYLETMVTVLDSVRRHGARTRPEIVRLTGLGRNVVTERIAQLIESGLITEGESAPSTGGRAPRSLRFDKDAGVIGALELGATGITVAVADLNGQVITSEATAADVTEGPEFILGKATAMLEGLLAASSEGRDVWGVGVGLPGPVEFATGRPVAPPLMPGWDGFGGREYLGDRFGAPVWVDNEVNLMALGEHRAGLAQGEKDFVYLKIGSGIGAGLVANGLLTRGAQGCSGDVGHIAVYEADILCRCGRRGCVEALAGGVALERDGLLAAQDGRSPYLARVLAETGRVEAVDVGNGATRADPVCVALLTRSARLVGTMLSGLVNMVNPSMIVIGGGVSQAGDFFMAAVKEAIIGRSLPLATRDLRIARSPLASRAGVVGAAHMVIDELFTPSTLATWLKAGSPAGMPHLAVGARDGTLHRTHESSGTT